jgi:GDP-L-fucose synthase
VIRERRMDRHPLQDGRIVVTGGRGFLGRHVVEQLRRRGCGQVLACGTPEYDFIRADDVRRMYDETKPQMVIHLAARVGGIEFNQAHPASLFYENIMMGVQLLHEGHLRGIEKFVAVGTVCAYPKFTAVPFREEELWNGYPEETNAPYGLAKKMILVGAQAYRRQHGFNAVFLIPANLYGPGDDFAPASSHVIPALIKKCVDARREGRGEITVWGTGQASREFLFVEDAAEGICLAAERYDGGEPVNLGCGRETPIRELVGVIAELTGFEGRIAWDAGKPDGQPRRMLDTERAKRLFGFTARTDLREGLENTIRWYEAMQNDGQHCGAAVPEGRMPRP